MNKKKILPLFVLASAMFLATACGTPATSSSQPASEATTSEKSETPATSEAPTPASSETPAPATSEEPAPASSSEAPAVKYTVTVTATDGATVTADKTEAEEGETVTLTATADEDCRVGKVYANGEEVAANEDGTYTVTVGAANVTITYTVDHAQAISTLNLSAERGYAFQDVAEKAFPGDTVVVTVHYNYTIYSDDQANASFLYINDVAMRCTEHDTNNLYFSFTMPEAETELVFSVESGSQSDSGRSFSVINGEGIKAYGYDANTKYYSVSFALYKKAGYAIDKITIDAGDGEVEITSSYNLSWSGNIGSFYYYGSIASDVTNVVIKIYDKQVGVYEVTYEGAEHIVAGLQDEYTEGDSVEISMSDLTFEDGYSYSNGTVAEVTTDSGETVTTSTNNYGRLYFTMPGENVTVKFINIITAQSFNITKDDGVKSVSICDYSGKDISGSCKASTYIYLKIETNDGYMVSSVTLNGSTMYYSSYSGAYTGQTSTEDGATNELVITTSQGYTVTTASAEGGRLVLDSTVYAGGSSVSGSVSFTNSFYTLNTITVTKADGTEVAADDIGLTINASTYSTRFTFTMPLYDITLTPVFNKAEGVAMGAVTAAEQITSWRISGNKSSNYIDSDMTADEIAATEFIDGEALQVSISHQAGYTVAVKIGDTVIEPSNDSGTYCTIYSGVTMSAGLSLELTATAKVAVNVTVEKPEGADVTVSFSVNGSTVESLFPDDNFLVNLTGDAGEGKAYVAKVYDAEGNLMTTNWSGYYTCTGDIKVVISVVSGGTLTITEPEEGNYYFDCSSWDSTTYTSTTYKNGDELAAGATFDVNLYVYQAGYHIKVVSNGVTLVDKDLEAYESWSETITVEGDVSIAITEVAAE